MDSQCTKDLQKKGVAYPRTCAECGLGPCKRYPPAAPVNTDPGAALDALMTILKALDGLTERERERVIRHAAERFGVFIP